MEEFVVNTCAYLIDNWASKRRIKIMSSSITDIYVI